MRSVVDNSGVVAEWSVQVAGASSLLQALLGGLVIAGLNLLGAVLVLVWSGPSERSLGAALG